MAVLGRGAVSYEQGTTVAYAASRSLVTQEEQLVTHAPPRPDYSTKLDLAPFRVAKAISVRILGGRSRGSVPASKPAPILRRPRQDQLTQRRAAW